MKNIDEIKKAYKLEKGILKKHYLFLILKSIAVYGAIIGLSALFFGPGVITSSIWIKILSVIGVIDFVWLAGSYQKDHEKCAMKFMGSIRQYLETDDTGNKEIDERSNLKSLGQENQTVFHPEVAEELTNLKGYMDMTMAEKIAFLSVLRDELVKQTNNSEHDSSMGAYPKNK